MESWSSSALVQSWSSRYIGNELAERLAPVFLRDDKASLKFMNERGRWKSRDHRVSIKVFMLSYCTCWTVLQHTLMGGCSAAKLTKRSPAFPTGYIRDSSV
jgi:hypothetical protein